MLHFMSKHAKFFYVFFFIIIISFVFFYIGPLDKSGGELPLIKVKDEVVTTEEFWRAYENVRNFYRDIYKEKFDAAMEKQMGLKDKVLSEMVTDKVLFVAAQDMGLTVSDRELSDAIMSEPAFQRDGKFRKDVYLNTLRINRITTRYYEERRREELLVRKMKLLLEDAVPVSEDELPQASGDNQILKSLRESLIAAKKSQAVQAYVEGLRKKYGVVVKQELVSS